MPDPPDNAKRAQRRPVSTAFRPIFVWCLGTLLLFGWDWHNRQLETTILVFRATVQGSPGPFNPISAKLSGHRIEAGGQMSLGWKTLELTGAGLETVQRKFFAWYGTNNLGEIRLARSKGTLEVLCDPSPRQIQVAGQFFQGSSANARANFPQIPVGAYRVTAQFAHSAERREVQVPRNNTTRLIIKPAFGTLDLTSDPSGAPFTLTDGGRMGLSLQGTTPARIDQVPAGQYVLSVQQFGSAKETFIQVKADQTNSSRVVFPYGTAQLATTPPGAAIYSGFNTLGKTPQTLYFPPGTYQLRLSLDGYQSLDLTVVVEEKKTVSVNTKLLDARVAEALDAAHAELNSASGDYARALSQIDQALRIDPDNANATALKAALMAAAKDREAKADAAKQAAKAQAAEQARKTQEEAKKAEAEARPQLAVQNFAKVIAREPNNQFFDIEVWRASVRYAQARAALMRYVEQGPDKWTLTSEARVDETMSVVKLGPKGTFSDNKSALVQLCELPGGETEFRCKIWIYTVVNPLKGWVPVHPKFYFPNDPSVAQNWRHRVTRLFKQNFAKELGTELK